MEVGGTGNIVTTGRKRVRNLQKQVEEGYMAGALIHKPENIYYYSGVFPNEPSFILVPKEGEPELIVAKASYQEAKIDSLLPVMAGELDIIATLAERLVAKGCVRPKGDTPVSSVWHSLRTKPLGVEYDYLPQNIREQLGLRSSRDITPLIWQQRQVKDEGELNYLRQACAIADEAMAEAATQIKVGMTERQVAGIFDMLVKAKGADESKARVRSGPNSAKAFTKWMGGTLEPGPLLIDYGARVKGYWSDITRTFYLGGQPPQDYVDLYNLVLDSVYAGLEEMKPGVEIYQVEERVRQVLASKGQDQNMIFTAGHAIGLEVHEVPVLSLKPEKVEDELKLPGWFEAGKTYKKMLDSEEWNRGPEFQVGNTFALEPGIYLPEIGIRIEDMVLITEQGAEFLSSYPRELDKMLI